MKKFIKSNLPTILALLFTIAILVGSFFKFQDDLSNALETTTEMYMEENAYLQAMTFHTKLNDQLVMLESQTRYFKDIDMNNYNVMKQTIMATKGIGAFKTIAVANAAGTTMNYNGTSSGNILMTDYFQDAMDGHANVSEHTYEDEEGDTVLVLAVPIIQENKTCGVVTGSFTMQTLRELIPNDSFDGKGYSILIAGDGTIISDSQNAVSLVGSYTNFFQLSQSFEFTDGITTDHLIMDMNNSETSVVSYRIGTQERMAVLRPIGIHDWYIITVLPKEVITEQSTEIGKMVAILVAAICFGFAVLTFAIIYLIKNNEIISKSNERYKMVTTQTQTVVFEYDFIKKRLELNGSTDFIRPDMGQVLLGDKASEILNLIHKDDRAVRDEIRGIAKSSTTSFRGECRLLCTDENYYWFRIKASVIRSDDGKALRFIGNVINVEEQMNQEKRLKQKAELDPLTGILNKTAMEQHVNDFLSYATEEDLYALYIIDLDNFKLVNDTLGHAVGDKVLSDIAKKMGVVFNESDCVGRIGGDEFAAFLRLSPEGRKVGMRIIENKGRALCNKMSDIYSDGKNEISVSASVGVALFPTHGVEYGDLYRKADAALYAAKHSGKNQFYIYREEILV